jgi:uncharacterized surface protein with fasciclin (FAS1) repeats
MLTGAFGKWIKLFTGFRKGTCIRLIIFQFILSLVILSCKSEPHESSWYSQNNLTICQYLELNQEEYSNAYRLLAEGKMLYTLCAYNPYGEDYTLFLPTNEAIERFIQQNHKYANFEELILDTSFVYSLVRYHTLKRKVHTDEFPFGALNDSTLTGERLSVGFHAENNNQLIKINNLAPVVKSNLNMTNGYIHVISEVLQKIEIPGYDWLQQQAGYSILAQAMELTGIRKGMWWNKYTILAEHDSIYYRHGIYSVEDLISRIATPGMSYSNKNNPFYMFAGYHIMGGEYFLNDLSWGSKNYVTRESKQLKIDVGRDIRINPGVDSYLRISESGDTTVVDYISPVWDNCNIITRTGPVHSISDVLFYEPFPGKINN